MDIHSVYKYFQTIFADLLERRRKQLLDISKLITIPKIQTDERGVMTLHYLPLRADEFDAIPLQTLATFNSDGHPYKKVRDHVWQRDDGKVILQRICVLDDALLGPSSPLANNNAK